MTDLEMTKLCAEAMGYVVEGSLGNLVRARFSHRSFDYRPLHDDAQAMALVKKFKLRVDFDEAALNDKPMWYAQTFDYKRSRWNTPAENGDLNRAIVECVAKANSVRPDRKEG